MLVIYAHPNKDGHCGHFLKITEDLLREKGIEYEVIDLYGSGFGPVLLPGEHYTSGHRDISPEASEIQGKIKVSSRIIFIYPTWWQNMPSILKGFIDRVFTPRFGYTYEGKIPRGLLKGKKALILTSAGSPRVLTKLIAGDRSVKVLKKDLLRFCGISSRAFIAGKCLKLTDAQKNKIEKLTRRGIRYLIR